MKNSQQGKTKILNNEYFQKKTMQQQAHRKFLKEKKRYSLLKKVVIALVAVAAILTIQSVVKLQLQINTINQQKQVVEKNLQSSKKQARELNRQIEQLKDKDYLQKYIREKYYYAKDNEQLYNLPQEAQTKLFDEK